MKTILTEEERNRIIDSMGWSLDAQERGDMHRLIQAVLAKLAQKEPVGHLRSDPAAPAQAPGIDYEALIKAAHDSNPHWAQGTMGCVAFKEGAEWYRAQVVAAIPDMLARCRYDGHCQHAVNCLDEDQACPQGQCKHPKVKP